MDALLTKPLAVEALQDVLERYGLAMNETNLPESAVDAIVSRPAEAPPIDFAQLRELTGDDAEFIRSIADSFESSSAQLIASLRAGAGSADGAQIAKAAHALKGASANLYAGKLRDMAAELEAMGSKLAKTDLELRIAAAARECERVCVALRGHATQTSATAVG
jgi:HPt (histidine-containing phosphotransfer) domain-containing protein